MAVELTMAQMKVAVLRHAFRGGRADTAMTGAALGVLLAGGTVYIAFVDPSLLAAAYAVWMVGWMLGPVFMGGGDETLRPEHFSLLGLPSRRLASGLLVAAFVGIAPVVSLVGLLGLLVAGARVGIVELLVAVPAAGLQLAVFVLLSKVFLALVGLTLRTRLGAIASGVLNGAILAALGQVWVFFVIFGQTGVPPVVRYLPSGWGLLAVQGDWWALAAMAGLVLLLLVAWAALLGRRLGATRTSVGGSRRPLTAGTSTSAIVAKELRTWWRDLVRNHQLSFALSYGVCFAASPLLVEVHSMLPYAGPIFIVMAAAMAANLYAADGTALWLTIMTPGAGDVRGRQLAWLSVQAPIALALAIVGAAISGGPWPLVLALLPALLGGAAGLIPLVSVYGLVPGIDPHRRTGNPLRTSENDSGLTGQAYAMLALVILTGAPAGLVALWFGWPGVVVGIVTGALCYWGFGLQASQRLSSHGPELLHTMRTGRKPETRARSWSRFDQLSKARQAIAVLCFAAGAIPLVPQGIIAIIFVANGTLDQSWFLATYLAPGLRYPVAAGFILVGLAAYGLGLWVFRSSRSSA